MITMQHITLPDLHRDNNTSDYVKKPRNEESGSGIKISLILPIYNVADYLPACLDSCLNQDLDPAEYEIICVNDGSTDRSPEIIREYQLKHSNIRVIGQENQGLSDARNNGLAIAQGKYFWFIDSDDTISANCLKSLIEIADCYNLDALKICPKAGDMGKVKFQPLFTSPEKQICIHPSGIDFIIESPEYDIAAWGYIFLRAFWETYNFRFYPRIYGEDSELIPLVIMKADKVGGIRGVNYYNYIQRPGSLVNSKLTTRKALDLSIVAGSYKKKAIQASDRRIKKRFFKEAENWYMIAIKALACNNAGKEEIEILLSNSGPAIWPCYGNALMKTYRLLPIYMPRLYIKIQKLLRKK